MDSALDKLEQLLQDGYSIIDTNWERKKGIGEYAWMILISLSGDREEIDAYGDEAFKLVIRARKSD
jgi:hypothetical protein